ncbi:MAG: DNA polymerase IV [Lentisphaeria bacterium]
MRTILHVDMDAFFAAVEVLDRPELRGRPLVVGAAPDKRGVVSTCSYEARRFGVHSAMPSRTAFRLCPQAVFVPPRHARYQEVSDRVMTILEEFTPLVEPVSIDEAFLDVTGVLRRWPDARALAAELKRRIRAGTGGLTASVGVAPNKFLAKLASDLEKPDGLTVTPFDPEGIAAFLGPLPVERLWGVGKVAAAALHAAGVRLIGDLQQRGADELARQLGPALAAHVHALAWGRDERPVAAEPEPEKSMSSETTYDEDCGDPIRLRQTLLEAAEEVGRRLRAAGRVAGTLHLKLRFADFTTLTRQAPLVPPTASDTVLIRATLALFERQQVGRPLRLVGMGVSGLRTPEAAGGAAAPPVQPLLFAEAAGDSGAPPADTPAATAGRQRLELAVDRLRARFGTGVLKRGRWTPPAP